MHFVFTNGGGDNNWANGANWDIGMEPGANAITDTAEITGFDVVGSASFPFDTLTINASTTVAVDMTLESLVIATGATYFGAAQVNTNLVCAGVLDGMASITGAGGAGISGVNNGTISMGGTVIFNSSGQNAVTGVVGSNSAWQDSSTNYGALNADAAFYGSSINYGAITASCTFEDSSQHEGTMTGTGTAHFSGNAVMTGSASINVVETVPIEFIGNSVCNGNISCVEVLFKDQASCSYNVTASFAVRLYNDAQQSAGTISAAYLECYGNSHVNAVVSLTTSAAFNDDSYVDAPAAITVAGHVAAIVYFRVNAKNYGTITSVFIELDGADVINTSSGTINGSCDFIDGINEGYLSGPVTFRGESYNAPNAAIGNGPTHFYDGAYNLGQIQDGVTTYHSELGVIRTLGGNPAFTSPTQIRYPRSIFGSHVLTF